LLPEAGSTGATLQLYFAAGRGDKDPREMTSGEGGAFAVQGYRRILVG